MTKSLLGRLPLKNAVGLLLCMGLGCLGLIAHAGEEGTKYVSDVLILNLRNAPANDSEATRGSLRSGDAVEVLGQAQRGRYLEVRTVDGRQGWVASRYLVNTPTAREQLKSAQDLIASLQEAIAARGSQAESADDVQTQRIVELERELAQVKSISADAIGQHAANQELLAQNARLRQQVEKAERNLQQLQQNLEQRWLLIGAGLVVAGLLIGALIKSRPKRSAWH